jgi:hypothetical protein
VVGELLRPARKGHDDRSLVRVLMTRRTVEVRRGTGLGGVTAVKIATLMSITDKASTSASVLA